MSDILSAKGQPLIHVGVLAAPQLHFALNGPFRCGRKNVQGRQQVECCEGRIKWNGEFFDTLCFKPQSAGATFQLSDVVIGVRFHWQRSETQTFGGTLRIIVDERARLVAINELPLEDYLVSVISSEMRSTSSPEFLKASAIVARSWLLAQLSRKEVVTDETTKRLFTINERERICWYTRSDHTLFDVCADDHCQRYQGLSRAENPHVRQAVAETRGMVLTYEGEVCDARYSKCCGGRSNEFRYCWEDIHVPYLTSVDDPFCHTDNEEVLREVLNDYDRETMDFYEWSEELTQQQLHDLILRNTQRDLGDILSMEAEERGPGGHISRLNVRGSLHTLTIGKELEIRRVLSHSHLKSSAFTVEPLDIREGIPQRFRLKGRGWGHGVGMCQIGAAVMGHQGYSYKEILQHYFPLSAVEQIYP